MDDRRPILSCCILILSILVTCVAISGRNYSLYKLLALRKRDRQILYIIHRNFEHSDFLNGVTNEAALPMHVIVEDHHLQEFEGILNNTDALYTKYDHYEFSPPETEEPWDSEDLNSDEMTLYDFHDFPNILKLYNYWESKYSKIIEKIVIGKTHEKKDIVILKIPGVPLKQGQQNPAVFILGGEEGRDWISPAVVLGYTKYLLEREVDEFRSHLDMYLLPVLNPDGYTYSFYKYMGYFSERVKEIALLEWDINIENIPELCERDGTIRKGYQYRKWVVVVVENGVKEIALLLLNFCIPEDRLWAKNRMSITPSIKCTGQPPAIATGVNIDRNWLYKLEGHDKVCGKIFFGNVLSQDETYNLSKFLDNIAPNTLAFINVKGFDNLITTPFSCNDKQQNNVETIKEILRQTSQDLNALFNKSYYYGTTGSLLFNYTGNCADWVKLNLNVPVVLTFYLKNFDNVLPHLSDIVPLSHEFEMGVNEVLSLTIDLYGPLFNSQRRSLLNTVVILFNMLIYFINIF